MDTKKRLSKQQHQKTLTSQNSDCYKTATVTKQRQLQNSDCYKMAKNNIKNHLKIVEKNLPIFKEINQRFYKVN